MHVLQIWSFRIIGGIALVAAPCAAASCSTAPFGSESTDHVSQAFGMLCDHRTTYYQDLDGDGYGNSSFQVTECTPPAGFVSKSGDCCDSDPNAFPGQTKYFTTPTACGNSTQSATPYDYDCNGVDDVQSNGPTDCQLANSCTINATLTGCVVNLPADCNGLPNNRPTGACGQTWNLFPGGCAYLPPNAGGPECVVEDTGPVPGGTQACR
jgi:hypothetical protein